ncbi:MAG TPA: PaaI family thioesterase [Solirubrobacterales bacterium]|nr:PaaI family thioesterase [Solirubrobacterales bacterium]
MNFAAMRQGEEAGTDALGELIGIEHLDAGDGEARARVAVADRILQPYGLVHGGVYPVVVETICSKATHEAVAEEGKVALGQSNSVTFLRPISAGHVNAFARARHRGRTSWVWQVEITDDDGRLCALGEMVVAVRER